MHDYLKSLDKTESIRNISDFREICLLWKIWFGPNKLLACLTINTVNIFLKYILFFIPSCTDEETEIQKIQSKFHQATQWGLNEPGETLWNPDSQTDAVS